MNTDVLRRMEASGWQAVAGTASLTDDDAETPTNGCADGLAGEGPEQERGDTMSPVSPARGVTSGTGTGDMICHPNPQEEPSRLRESAGARPEGKEGLEDGERSAGPMQPQPAQLGPAGEPASEPASEPSAGTPTLERFLKLWPTTMADSLERTASAWAALDWEQRREAVRAVPRFLDHLKALKRDRIPAGFTYLAEKRWLHMPAEAEAHRAASSFVVLNPLTKDFWAVLFDRIRQGQPVAVMLMLARDGKATQCRLGEFPTALRDSLSACPAGSERGAAWLGWLAARGHRMPDLKPEAWVFLPPDLPPGHDPAHGVGHGLGDDRGHF
jgi:hypothetical protein